MKKINKILISSIVGLVCVAGIIAIFKNSPIEIESYTKFVTSFAAIFIPWVTITAAGGESKRLIQTKFGNNSGEVSYQPPQKGTNEGGK